MPLEPTGPMPGHEGVRCVFGIPGEENIHLTDALSKSAIRYVLVRHEQAASFMAEIYGRLTGRASLFGHLGPGAINLLLERLTPTQTATLKPPLSRLVVGLNRIYKESHQSVVLPASMFSPVTSGRPDSHARFGPRDDPKLAQTERPGSVYLKVPEDVESSPVAG